VEYGLEEVGLVVAQVQADLAGDGGGDPAQHPHLLPGEEMGEALVTRGRAGQGIQGALVTQDRALQEVEDEVWLGDLHLGGIQWGEEDL